MKKENVLESCYSLLRNVTPLDYDCGKLCQGKCCKGDDKTGMLLFPGEENLIDKSMEIVVVDGGHKIAVCKGECDRNKRPLACRIYPIFPVIKQDSNGEYIETVFDSRADCPLTSGEFKITRSFVKAVKRVGKFLLLNEETEIYYRALSEEIEEYICFKKIFEKQ